MQLTRFLLSALGVAGAVGLTAETLLREARTEISAAITIRQLDTELRALADKSWITPFTPALAARRWRITALGQSALQEAGLA